jgi:predicted FMN-binding regulatory protein PaiB
VKHYPAYQATDEEAWSLLDSQPMARLVSTGADGWPYAGIYVFATQAPVIEFHLERTDHQLEQLRRDPRALVVVDEVLSFAPSHWIDPDDASHADQFYRSAAFRGTVELIEDPATVVGHLGRILSRYQPEGRHRPVRVDEPLYARPLSRLVFVRITTVSIETKFKLGQRTPRRVRAPMLRALESRGAPSDPRTLEELRAHLDVDESGTPTA